MEPVILRRGVNSLKFGQSSLEYLVGEVEEDFCEDGQMPMEVRKIEISMFAAGGVGSDEDVVEALGDVDLFYFVSDWGWVVGKILKA